MDTRIETTEKRLVLKADNNFTNRQAEIIQLLLDKVTDNKTIAQQLEIPTKSADKTIARIFDKIGITSGVRPTNKNQAIKQLLEDGLIDESEV